MTDQIAHILILLCVATLVLGIAAVMVIGRARLRKQGRAALPTNPHAVRLEESARLDTVNSAIDYSGHGS